MNIFIAFANQDRDVRDKLLRQINLVKDRQGWNIWSAKEIKAGAKQLKVVKSSPLSPFLISFLQALSIHNCSHPLLGGNRCRQPVLTSRNL